MQDVSHSSLSVAGRCHSPHLMFCLGGLLVCCSISGYASPSISVFFNFSSSHVLAEVTLVFAHLFVWVFSCIDFIEIKYNSLFLNIHINSFSLQTVTSIGYKNSQSCQQPTAEKHVNTAQGSALLIPEPEQQGEKGNIHQVKQTVPIPGKQQSCRKEEPVENSESCSYWNNQAVFKTGLYPEKGRLILKWVVSIEIILSSLFCCLFWYFK